MAAQRRLAEYPAKRLNTCIFDTLVHVCDNLGIQYLETQTGQKGIMQIISKRLGVMVTVFLAGIIPLFSAQNSGSAGAAASAGDASTAIVDHSQAYYHFMLARRYQE